MSPLAPILTPYPPDFALLHRPRSGHPDRIDVLLGDAVPVARVADIPLPPPRSRGESTDALVLLPYGQLAERGLACHPDGTPLVVLPVRRHDTVSVAEALQALPHNVPVLNDARFELDDARYADVVRRVLADEIGRGEGSNFVIRRAFHGTVAGDPVAAALAAFRRLLVAERGAYWTFLVHAAGRTLVGASPELHASLAGGVVTMTPIAGTYRYPPGGHARADLVRFLGDRKEAEELTMVVDEELKVLGRICPLGARLSGPRLTEMAHLAHTEYAVRGRTPLDVREVLRETMFAPTVIGSPLANACRVVAGYERHGRGYYGGVAALLGQRAGRRTLDSAILIRTAELAADGALTLGVGTTLVRRSDPAAEVAETWAKARGVLTAFGAQPVAAARNAALEPTGATTDPVVAQALAARNDRLSRFWLAPGGRRAGDLRGRILVVDADDWFTAMLAHQLRALGLDVTVTETPKAPPGYDVVVLGPGPGDPTDAADPKMAALRTLAGTLLAARTPVLAVCLGHQTVAGLLGLPLRRRPVPAQGEQRTIDLFGQAERVGFYNTFAAYAGAPTLTGPYGDMDVCRDPRTGEVYALRAYALRTVQFHPESVLTTNGAELLRDLMTALLRVPAVTG